MKTYTFDALDEDRARKFIGCKVIDDTDESVGNVDGLWMDPSTHRVAYLGVKSSWLSGNVHVVPAGNVQITEEGSITKLGCPVAQPKFTKRPSASRIARCGASGSGTASRSVVIPT